MTLAYTIDQLTRETQLLVSELAILSDLIAGEGAGVRALGLAPDSPFAISRHPDDLSEVRTMAIYSHIERLERYVQQQEWADEVPGDLSALDLIVGRVFSPAVIADYAQERADYAETIIPGPFETGAGDIPAGMFYSGILAQLVNLARARLKVDTGERLTLADIALLLDVREATVVTNAHRKNFPTVEDDNRRYAEPSEVLPWMLKQGYRPTRRPGPDSARVEPASEDGGIVFVPVARDGTWFGPQCRSGGRFTIGAKGEEVKYTDYFEALDALAKMSTPRWRRPNQQGNFGIVSGVRFDRKRRADLECELG